MAWSKEKSRERVLAHLSELGEIEVKPFTREMNLDNLTEKRCRRIHGSHIYTYPCGFTDLASMPLDKAGDAERYKKVIQATHVYQREVGRIVESKAIFNAKLIHFQGHKAHGLVYRPYNDPEAMAAHAVLMLWVQDDFVRHVFNPAYPGLLDVKLMGGADIGHAIGTRNGETSDRELLFLGSPANHAAKIMREKRLRVAARLYEELPLGLQEWCAQDGDDYRLLIPSQACLDRILDEYGVAWDREASRERVDEDKRQFPLSEIEYSGAQVKIDFDALSICNNKRVRAVSLFADVAGFTAYIDAAETEEEQQEALRLFHIIRRETARVVRKDYEGVRVQFQGDRIQAICHTPADKEASFSGESVKTAIALQLSLETVIKPLFSNAGSLQLAIGCDLGVTLASNLGKRGHRDRICLGHAVETAAQREEALEGGQTGISGEMYCLLPTVLQDFFEWDAERGCYVASNPTPAALKARLDASLFAAGIAATVHHGSSGTCVTPTTPGHSTPGRTVPVSSSYGPSPSRGK